MKVLLVSALHPFAGSALTIASYARHAKTLGHEIAVFGEPSGAFPDVPRSLDVEGFEVAVFVVNETTDLPDLPHLARLLDGMPKERRLVIDCSGRYNDTVRIDDDLNHLDQLDGHPGEEWVESLEAVGSAVLQPTLRPLRADVRPFLFHGYDPEWERPLDLGRKPYGIVYVGDNWFRWRVLMRFLEAADPIRATAGPTMVAGEGWEQMPSWLDEPLRSAACFTDTEHLRRLEVEVRPPVSAGEVIATMSLGTVNPVLPRPISNELQLVTPRFFETVAAGTIPLFDLDSQFATEIYGPEAAELVLGDDPAEQLADVFRRPSHYGEVATEIRRHLREHHSFAARLEELVDVCHELREGG
jgi:Glycosyl transferases group 1